MNILVVNCGSSSLSFKVYSARQGKPNSVILTGKARNVATRTQADPVVEWTAEGVKRSWVTPLPSHRLAAHAMLAILQQQDITVDALGHRFVHGGEIFQSTARITPVNLERLKQCLPLAPIHNPNSLSVIEECLAALPDTLHFAVFDTAFHARLTPAARTYALPLELAQQYGLRKYGFHGLSYQYVSARAAELLGKTLNEVRLIMCHLGTGGSSVCAFADGHSVDTSMGFSPLAGLVMSTRCGDIDAEVALELVRRGMSADEVSRVLNQQSGLIGMSGYSSNLGEVIEAAVAGNELCRVAYQVYVRRLEFYLGAYSWLLNGADAIVFTDDIGVSSWQLRQEVCGNVQNLGVLLDPDANRSAARDSATFINHPDSRIKLLVIPTDEEQVILEEVMRAL